MSFILDALRKSEHERQRSALPGLSQVPQAAPAAQMPRWALVVIGVLGAAVLVLGGAWWQSTRARTDGPTAGTPPMVERSMELPPPTSGSESRSPSAPDRPLAPSSAVPPRRAALATAATTSPETTEPTVAAPAPEQRPDSAALPSAAALAAQGVALPPLRLELHAYSERPRDRFVFVNGRKYVEGDRLIEGPQLLAIEPRGAVLTHAGRSFLLVPQ